MKNLLILGTGRSGTSMVAALFRKNPGIFFGYEMMRPTPANPYGYYEDWILNMLNDMLIKRMVGSWVLDLLPQRLARPLGRWLFAPLHVDGRGLWLAAPARLRRVRVGRELHQLMRFFTNHRPFCLKDPRFSVTLPIWRPHLANDTRYLVVYRDPDRTVDSMLRNAKESYKRPLALTPSWGFTCWYRTYERILDELSDEEEWLFAPYDRIISGEAMDAIRNFTEANVDDTQVDATVSKSKAKREYQCRAADRCHLIYQRLEQRSAHDIAEWSSPERRHRVAGASVPPEKREIPG